MKFTKKNTIFFILTIIIIYFLSTYQMPYYIQKPGSADPLNPIVQVNGGHESAGEMHLVTVSGLQATPIQYVLAKILPHNDIQPIENIFPEGISHDEYYHAQLQFMENSQEASLVVAYEASDKEIEIEYVGVYVMGVLQGMPAEDKLKMGDRIVRVDDQEIKVADDLIDYVSTIEAGDSITIEYLRDDQSIETDITIDYFPDDSERVGVGISLVTDREVHVDPKVDFSSGNIGGPSAGLMFALEIYDQLNEEDITKGYNIAGSGEIDYEGNVRRIGGIDKKIVAAERENIDIFFAVDEDGQEESNYDIALAKAEEIGTDMEIVPVKHFTDAVEYLEDFPED